MAGAEVTAEGGRQSKQVDQSLLTVLVAFLANLLIAIAKSVAAGITASASMLASPAPVTSHSEDGLPGRQFSATLALAGLSHGPGAAVVNDQV